VREGREVGQFYNGEEHGIRYPFREGQVAKKAQLFRSSLFG